LPEERRKIKNGQKYHYYFFLSFSVINLNLKLFFFGKVCWATEKEMVSIYGTRRIAVLQGLVLLLSIEKGASQECAANGACDSHERWCVFISYY
jgi:hypothetical protein